MKSMDRREFLYSVVGLSAAGLLTQRTGLVHAATGGTGSRGSEIRFGLVTYMWGADWDLPTLIANCEKAGAAGVELRTGHAHGVEPGISTTKQDEVRSRFADSPVKLVGLGTNEAFHHADPMALKTAIERAKQFIELSHSIGGSGVKVKPNDLPPGVPHNKTIEQIGKSLNELGQFAAERGQQLRLEVHGQCAPLPIIAEIMHVADNPNVAVCWNSNPQDLQGDGLKHNFQLVQNRLGATLHARQLDGKTYPYPELFRLLNSMHYDGWVLIEASDKQADRVAALARQRQAFEKLIHP